MRVPAKCVAFDVYVLAELEETEAPRQETPAEVAAQKLAAIEASPWLPPTGPFEATPSKKC